MQNWRSRSGKESNARSKPQPPCLSVSNEASKCKLSRSSSSSSSSSEIFLRDFKGDSDDLLKRNRLLSVFRKDPNTSKELDWIFDRVEAIVGLLDALDI